jgi:hypothetical protein
MSRATRLALALIVASLATGCGGGGPPPRPDGVEVAGKVLLPNGSPLTGGTLVLRPVAGLHGATAQIGSTGAFALVDPSGKKSVVPGQYQVFVRFNDPNQKALSAAVNKKYQNSEDVDSDVVVTIGQSTNDLVIKLNR